MRVHLLPVPSGSIGRLESVFICYSQYSFLCKQYNFYLRWYLPQFLSCLLLVETGLLLYRKHINGCSYSHHHALSGAFRYHWKAIQSNRGGALISENTFFYRKEGFIVCTKFRNSKLTRRVQETSGETYNLILSALDNFIQ